MEGGRDGGAWEARAATSGGDSEWLLPKECLPPSLFQELGEGAVIWLRGTRKASVGLGTEPREARQGLSSLAVVTRI